MSFFPMCGRYILYLYTSSSHRPADGRTLRDDSKKMLGPLVICFLYDGYSFTTYIHCSAMLPCYLLFGLLLVSSTLAGPLLISENLPDLASLEASLEASMEAAERGAESPMIVDAIPNSGAQVAL
jgi:hypothetical protein